MKWPEAPFAEVAEIVTGNTPPKKNPDNYGPGVPWVKPPDLDGWEPIIATAEYLSPKGQRLARLLPEGTVLVCCIGSIGRVGIAGTTLATNQQINALVFGRRVDPRFGYYYCRLIPQQLQAAARNAVVPILNKSNFGKIKMPLPPISEQRRIVEILDQADALRKKRAEADAKAARILPALFYKMFGDPATNPKGWDLRPFDGAFLDCTARCPKLQRNEYQPTGRFPVVDQGKELVAGYSDDESLVVRTDTAVIVFGDHTRVVKYVDFPFVAGADGSRVFKAQDGCEPVFLAAQLELLPIPNLGYSRHMREVRRLQFVVPPPELQEEYARRAATFRPLRDGHQRICDQINALWSVLLHRAFSGDLTAKWREAHMKELLAEMETQAKTLESCQSGPSAPRGRSPRGATRSADQSDARTVRRTRGAK